MTCGLNGGIDITFLKSGLSVNPYDVSTRSGQREFSHTKATISREDGELISERAKEYEPVLLKFGGITQDRYMFHPEAVKLNDGDAKLTLYDAEKILEQGTVNKNFQNTELGTVIDHIVGNRQDPNGVIVGIKHPSEAITDISIEDAGRLGLDGFLGGAASLLTGAGEWFANPEFADTSLNLTGMAPFGALNKAASAFALQTWVDPDGYLHYGMRGQDPNSLTIGADEEGVRLKEYNVTVGSGKLTQIILKGRYEYITNHPRNGPKERTSPNVYSYGKAYLVDENGDKIEGRSLAPDEIVPATNPKAVEDAARMTLANHYMNRKNGNIVLNAGASSDKAGLTSLAVGDLLAASGEIEEYCQRKVDTGIFTVQSVQHTLDTRRGWLIDVGVAALPASDIQSESWLENPENDTRWDSVDDYGMSDFGT